MRSAKTGGQKARHAPAPTTGAKQPGRRSPPPPESSAGEEDPGASLGDPAMQDAMRGEARASGDDAAARQDEQSRTARSNVREGYAGKRR